MSEYLFNWKKLNEEPTQHHTFQEFFDTLPTATYEINALTNLYNLYCGKKVLPQEFKKDPLFQEHFKLDYQSNQLELYEKKK